MNTCTPALAGASPPQLSAMLFEARCRAVERRPTAPVNVVTPTTPEELSAREEGQALRFAIVLGLASIAMWGLLFHTMVNNLQVPSLL